MLGFDDGPGEADYQEKLIEACARFELKVKGKVMFDAGDIFHIGDSVDMTVPLQIEGAAWSGEQTGDVKPIGYDRGAEMLEFLGQGLGAAMGINVPNDATKNDYIHCTTKHAVGKLGALATNLLSDNDLTVHLSLGKTSDATVSCPKLGSFPFPPLVVDPQNLKDAEVAEATDDGLLLEKWQRARTAGTHSRRSAFINR